MTEDDLPPLAPEDAAEADELLRGATTAGRAREALGTHLDALLSTGRLVAVQAASRRRDGRARGMAALIPDGTHTTARRPAGFTPTTPATSSTQTASAAAIAARMVEGDWLVCVDTDHADDGLLHHARLVPAQLTALAVHGLASATVEHVLLVTCMRLRTAASRPGEVHRRTRARCGECCEVLGYPTGVGSPSVGVGCGVVLEGRLAGL